MHLLTNLLKRSRFLDYSLYGFDRVPDPTLIGEAIVSNLVEGKLVDYVSQCAPALIKRDVRSMVWGVHIEVLIDLFHVSNLYPESQMDGWVWRKELRGPRSLKLFESGCYP